VYVQILSTETPDVILHYRGVATYDGPLPVAMDTVRQSLGQGVRAGMYVLSKKSVYWFIAMNCPEVSLSPGIYYSSCLGAFAARMLAKFHYMGREGGGGRWIQISDHSGYGNDFLFGEHLNWSLNRIYLSSEARARK